MSEIYFGNPRAVIDNSWREANEEAQWRQREEVLYGGPGRSVGLIRDYHAHNASYEVGYPPSPLLTYTREQVDKLRLAGLREMDSHYGRGIPQVWGKMRLSGNVIWAGDFYLTDVDGSIPPPDVQPAPGDPVPAGFVWRADVAILLCRGPVNSVSCIWGDDAVIYAEDALIANGSAVLGTGFTYYGLSIYHGSEGQSADAVMENALGSGNVPAYRGSCYVVISGLDLTRWGNKLPTFSFAIHTTARGSALIADVLEDVAEQCGLADADFDFSAATDFTCGYVLSDRTQAASGLAPLLALYQTDLAEVDGLLCAIHRGCSSVGTVSTDDLGAHQWSGLHDPPPSITTQLAHELELPSAYELTYFDPTRAYENNMQRAIRHAVSGYVQETRSFQAPIVLGANGARRTAERELYQAWMNRASFALSLGPKWLKLVAGSPLTVPVGGASNRVRIHGIDMALPGELRLSAMLDADFVLDQDASGDDTTSFGAAFTPPPIEPGHPALDFRVPGNSMYLPGIGV